MAIDVTTFDWTSVSITPNPVAARGSLAIKAGVVATTHTYDYTTAVVCGNYAARAVSGDRLLQAPKYLSEQ